MKRARVVTHHTYLKRKNIHSKPTANESKALFSSSMKKTMLNSLLPEASGFCLLPTTGVWKQFSESEIKRAKVLLLPGRV